MALKRTPVRLPLIGLLLVKILKKQWMNSILKMLLKF